MQSYEENIVKVIDTLLASPKYNRKKRKELIRFKEEIQKSKTDKERKKAAEDVLNIFTKAAKLTPLFKLLKDFIVWLWNLFH